MFICFYLLFLLFNIITSKTKELIILDNFEHGEMDYGSEDRVVDYALLARDTNMDLPSAFTICSSVHFNFCQA